MILAGDTGGTKTIPWSCAANCKAFSNKGRFSDLMKNIPLQVALDSRTALLGADHYALRI